MSRPRLYRLTLDERPVATLRAVRIHPAGGGQPTIVPFANAPDRVVVSAIDRAGKESELAVIKR
jgi:hypothetical protein